MTQRNSAERSVMLHERRQRQQLRDAMAETRHEEEKLVRIARAGKLLRERR